MRPPLAAFKASKAPRTSEQEALLISSVPSLSAEARSPSDSAEAPVMAEIPKTPAKADDARIRRIFIFYPCATGGRLWRAATNIAQSLTHDVTSVYQSG